MAYLFYLLAALAGLSNPVQSAANAASNKATGQPVVTAMALYAVAVSCLLATAAAMGLFGSTGWRRSVALLAEVPAWAYVNGLCNVAFVLAGAIATRRIGSAAFTVTVSTCAILLSVALDAFGALGLEQHALNWQRSLGAALAVAGVVLVSLF